jgi:PKD repeat protein
MGDLNADGHIDLVSIGDHGSPYINTDQHGIMVWFSDGTGTWSVYQNGNFGYGGLALGDVDNDGNLDVGYGMHHNYSATDFGDQLLEVALGDGSGQNWIPWDDGLATNGETWGMFATDFADVDNDGDLDIGSISFGCCAGIHVYLNQGDGNWMQSFGFIGGNSDMFFELGEVNGDGYSDFVVSHGSGTVYLGDGAGDFTLADGNLPNPILEGASLGDVNHDGKDELAFCNTNDGVEVWSWSSPGVWVNLSNGLPTSGTCEATQLFDMDMDGHRDVAFFGDGQLRIWGGDGVGGWSEITSFTTPSPGYLSAFRIGGDVDDNGYPDIAIIAEEGSWPNENNYFHFYKESSSPSTLEIKPVCPSGAETLHAGSVYFIDWISAIPTGGPGTVSLELSLYGPTGPWQTIVSGIQNSGRYQWTIPSDTPTTDNAYIQYSLTITDTATTLSPAPFNIQGSIEEPIHGLEAINDSPTVVGESTTLTGTVSSGTNITYSWNFGDGTSGEGQILTHTYPYISNYTAILTATNSISIAVTTTSVTIYEEEISGLTAVNSSPTNIGETTVLTATVLSGTNISYGWAFGDEGTGEGTVISHTYSNIGEYSAIVTATNSTGYMTATTQVTITDHPITDLSFTDNSPNILGDMTIFTTTITEGSNVTYILSFGDTSPPETGFISPGTPLPTSHIYLMEGVFTAWLTTSNSSNFLTATNIITINTNITDTLPPTVSSTSPISGEMNVQLDNPIIITFSEPIRKESFIFSIDPNLGNWTLSWSEGDSVVTMDHSPYNYETKYRLSIISVNDMVGNPLPRPYDWWFKTSPKPIMIFIPLVTH